MRGRRGADVPCGTMSEASWDKGLNDAANGVHRDGQDEDYERGWRSGWPEPDPHDDPSDTDPMPVPEGCIEVIDERHEPEKYPLRTEITVLTADYPRGTIPVIDEREEPEALDPQQMAEMKRDFIVIERQQMAEMKRAFEVIERRFGGIPPGTIDVWDEHEESEPEVYDEGRQP